MGRLETRLEQAVRTAPDDRVIVFRSPLAMAEGVRGRLTRRPGPVILITTDFDDPMPVWRKTKEGRKTGEQAVRWHSMAQLAQVNGPVRKVIKAEAASLRRFLPTALAAASPRLAPALVQLQAALPRLRQNQDNWTLRHQRELMFTLYAFNAATHEGLQLRVTHEALDRWPTLEPDERAPGKYAVRWTLRPEEIPELAAILAAPQEPEDPE